MTSSFTENNDFTEWKLWDHFAYKADKGNNVTVQGKLCLPTVKILLASKDLKSNFKAW